MRYRLPEALGGGEWETSDVGTNISDDTLAWFDLPGTERRFMVPVECLTPVEFDTTNNQAVVRVGDTVTVALPLPQMTLTEALRHAAWLVMLADLGDLDNFHAVFAAIKEA